MSEILKTDVAGILSGRSGVIINTSEIYKHDKHYNVVVTKVDDLYTVTAEEASYEIFIDYEDNPLVVNQYVDRDVKTTKPWLFGLFKGGTRYLDGVCEKKERRKVEYITNNLTIKQ